MNRKIVIGVVAVILFVGAFVGYVSTCNYTGSSGLYVADTDVEVKDGDYSVSFEVRLSGTGSISFYGVSVVLYAEDGDRLADRRLGSFLEPRTEAVSLVVPERPHRITINVERVERASNTKGFIRGRVYEHGEYAEADARLFKSSLCRV